MGNERLNRAREILELESRAVSSIPLNEGLDKAVEIILNCTGKVVTSGMGKAGLIAQKVASTFSSTGTPAVFLHPGEAQHGDLGMLQEHDVLILFSNSGQTREAIELVELAERMLGERLPIIVITSKQGSALTQSADVVLYMGEFEEAGTLKMAPTTSTTVMLALGDVLAILVKEDKGFGIEDFAKRHHGGYLGQKSRNHGEA